MLPWPQRPAIGSYALATLLRRQALSLELVEHALFIGSEVQILDSQRCAHAWTAAANFGYLLLGELRGRHVGVGHRCPFARCLFILVRPVRGPVNYILSPFC